MKMFECIVDDGKSVMKSVIVSKSKKAMLEEYGGNGEFVRVVDVTKEFKIDAEALEKTLNDAEYGHAEKTLILALLEEHVLKNL